MGQRALPRAVLAENGPQIAKVIPGSWMLMKNVCPSGENVGPANSLLLGRRLSPKTYVSPSGVISMIRFSPSPSSASQCRPKA